MTASSVSWSRARHVRSRSLSQFHRISTGLSFGEYGVNGAQNPSPCGETRHYSRSPSDDFMALAVALNAGS